MQARRWWCTALALALARVGAGAGSPKPLCAPTANCTNGETMNTDEYFYEVSGLTVNVKYKDGYYFKLKCNSLAPDHPELPRFATSVRVKGVMLEECSPPTNGSYVDVIAALNVTGFTKLILNTLPAGSVLEHSHLTGMQKLSELEVYGKYGSSFAPGALAALSGAHKLQTLQLKSVRTPAAELPHLPTSIRELVLWDTHAVSGGFDLLPNLTSLYLSENYPIAVNVSNATTVKKFDLSTPNTVIPEDALPPTLTDLTLSKWNDTRPMPRTHCVQLKILTLIGTNNDNYPLLLPDEWLARCNSLKTLGLSFVPIRGHLPTRLLANATALQTIRINYCNLTSLPQGFFDDTTNLIVLDLSDNKLTSLPSGLFLHTKRMSTLTLSHNRLSSAVAQALSVLSSLRQLRLNNNVDMGDFCDGGHNSTAPAHSSALRTLTALQALYLSYTNVTRVCRDWRHDLRNLTWLELEYTAITHLTYTDLQFSGSTEVKLGGGEYELRYQPEDFKKSLTQNITQTVITFNGSLVCDCNTYWAALAFHKRPSLKQMLRQLKCDKKRLAKVDLDRLTCPASEDCAALRGNCTCRKRDDYEHGSVVIMQCFGLTELPRLPASKHKWRLLLANNNISHIDAANVSADIVELDLRNNAIKRLDGETATKLASIPLLQLTGNPLDCGCESYDMLRALLDTSSRWRKVADVRCNGTGQLLTAVNLTSCSVQRHMPVHQSMLPLVLPLVILLAVAILAYGFIARPATRLWIKMLLMRLGWMPRPFEPADDDRQFDAFISFAHEDEELVVEQLAARLESGPQPYRLCLHYRDWTPGEWIPAQIAASVRASRRTVAVVSAHYLQSGWARAEFREATAASLRDGTPRLVVVLLDDPERLTLEADPELSAYVRHNVYVRWGDPWFWVKMKQALPLPRTRRLKKTPSPPVPVQNGKCTQMHISREAVPNISTTPALPKNVSNITPATLTTSCSA